LGQKLAWRRGLPVPAFPVFSECQCTKLLLFPLPAVQVLVQFSKGTAPLGGIMKKYASAYSGE